MVAGINLVALSFAALEPGTWTELIAGLAGVLVAAVLGGLALWESRKANRWARLAAELAEANRPVRVSARLIVTPTSDHSVIELSVPDDAPPIWLHEAKAAGVLATFQEFDRQGPKFVQGPLATSALLPAHINTGETHYPYLLPGEKAEDLPHISGVHGVFKSLDEFLKNPGHFVKDRKEDEFFTADQFKAFYAKQVVCVEHLDAVVGRFMERCPDNTYFMIMSDHGELFGEDGYFGHGPIFHEKVFEVFYLEGKLP